ncbi:DoxX family protein [Streptomyces sp. JJ36]|uniref:DoxX family protein n=1 Tax=Streptomyces sp. JJ36 TaxID=2736645 RepID=UPI001F389BC6|nr:DoxX family protein [Streptomyces sp. JJ36]MCF6521906.1 DoxX family protein [Streptomyces sp. JJ36]
MTTQTLAVTAGSSSTLGSAPRTRKGRGALWALQLVTAVLYLNGGVLKLAGAFGAPEAFDAMGLGTPGMYLVGTAELAGGIGLLIPRLAGLAALAFVPMMAGAVVIEAATHGAGMIVAPLGALAAVSVLAWYRRGGTAELLRRVRRVR